jgi:hypothetical protein
VDWRASSVTAPALQAFPDSASRRSRASVTSHGSPPASTHTESLIQRDSPLASHVAYDGIYVDRREGKDLVFGEVENFFEPLRTRGTVMSDQVASSSSSVIPPAG